MWYCPRCDGGYPDVFKDYACIRIEDTDFCYAHAKTTSLLDYWEWRHQELNAEPLPAQNPGQTRPLRYVQQRRAAHSRPDSRTFRLLPRQGSREMQTKREQVTVKACTKCGDIFETVGQTSIGLAFPRPVDTDQYGYPQTGTCPKHSRKAS